MELSSHGVFYVCKTHCIQPTCVRGYVYEDYVPNHIHSCNQQTYYSFYPKCNCQLQYSAYAKVAFKYSIHTIMYAEAYPSDADILYQQELQNYGLGADCLFSNTNPPPPPPLSPPLLWKGPVCFLMKACGQEPGILICCSPSPALLTVKVRGVRREGLGEAAW